MDQHQTELSAPSGIDNLPLNAAEQSAMGSEAAITNVIDDGGPLTPQLVEQAYHASAMDQFFEWMQIGGPVVWVLCIFSVIALTLIIAKLFQFYQEKPEQTQHLDRALTRWQQGAYAESLNLLDAKYPVDQLLKVAIEGQHNGINLSVLKDELQRLAARRLGALSAYLRPLEIIATISPLLGLLGTVLGMIEAFQHMQAAGNQVDPSVLSGGIWKALLTTAVGLVVAIPVMLAFNWMERKVERVATLMNDVVTRSFTLKTLQAHINVA